MLEQGVIWPVRIAPMAPGRGLYKDSALFSLTIDPGGHGAPWSTRRSIGANCADCVRCNAWLTVATCVCKRRVLSSLVDGRSDNRMLMNWYPGTQHSMQPFSLGEMLNNPPFTAQFG